VDVLCSGRAAGDVVANSVSVQLSLRVDSSPTEDSDHDVVQSSPAEGPSPAGTPESSNDRLLAVQQTVPFVYRESVLALIHLISRKNKLI